jgi:hypothetical protein
MSLERDLSAAQKTGFRIKDQGFSVFISVCFRVIPWLIGVELLYY